MSFLYNYFFERNDFVSPGEKIYKQGDKVSYRSKSRNVIYNDGVIGKCYDTGVYISYGKDEKFHYGALGTTKFIRAKDVDKLIGPRHKDKVKLPVES